MRAYLPWLIGGFTVTCLVLILPLVLAMRRQEKIGLRLGAVQRRALLGTRERRTAPENSQIVTLVGRIGDLLARAMLSARTVQEVREMLATLGFRSSRSVGIFIGTKVVLFALLPPLAFLAGNTLGLEGQTRVLFAVVGAVLGLMLPEMVVRNLRKRYLKQVERGVADGLDMVVICSEAGLGLESAIQRTAQEIKPAWPALGNELSMTASELRLLNDRRAALTNLGERTQLEPLRRLGRVMIQSQQYGTPLTQALRTLAAELRQDQLIAFEARAAKLPVLLTVPMIVFILPTVFLVVAGPALLAVVSFL